MPAAQEPASPTRRTVEVVVVLMLAVTFLGVSYGLHRPFAQGVNNGEVLGIILAAGLTLIMYSFLYRDNPLFKVAENLYVGVTLGYGIMMTWWESLLREVVDPIFRAPAQAALLDALLHRSFPILLGLLLVTRLSRKHGWLSRYAYALMVGWGAGVGIAVVMRSYILKQLEAAVAPFQEAFAGQVLPQAFSAAWFADVAAPAVLSAAVLVGTVAVLWYFFFSVEHKRVGGAVSRVGIWVLMISFGASFGYTVMGRVALLIDRVQFLLFEWLKIQ